MNITSSCGLGGEGVTSALQRVVHLPLSLGVAALLMAHRCGTSRTSEQWLLLPVTQPRVMCSVLTAIRDGLHWLPCAQFGLFLMHLDEAFDVHVNCLCDAQFGEEEEGLHFRPSSSHCGCFRDQRAVPASGSGCLPGEVSDDCSIFKRSYVYSRLFFVGTLCTFCQRRKCCAWLRRQRTLQCTDSAVDPFGMQCQNEHEKSLSCQTSSFSPSMPSTGPTEAASANLCQARGSKTSGCARFNKVEDLAFFPQMSPCHCCL